MYLHQSYCHSILDLLIVFIDSVCAPHNTTRLSDTYIAERLGDVRETCTDHLFLRKWCKFVHPGQSELQNVNEQILMKYKSFTQLE
jgi:hypothetical protein